MKKKRNIQFILVIISIVVAMTTLTTFAATSRLSKPEISKVAVSGKTVTIEYNEVRNAKEYKVYKVNNVTNLEYLKTVRASRKSLYSDTKKYKLKKSGSKYKVYKKKTKKTYRLLATSKKTKTSFEGTWNTSYKLVVKAFNGKKKSFYSAPKTVKIGKKPEIETYVFFGSDSRKNDASWRSQNGGAITTDISGTQGVPRSDVIMLICVDRAEKTIKLVSIYRDTAINESAKGFNFQKANKAYADYGPKAAVKVIERNLDIKIKGYAASNFKGVADVIDDMGGITISIENENTYDEVYKEYKLRTVADTANNYIDHMNKLYQTNTSHIKAGSGQKLQGLQAVAYARVRYTEGSDMQRSVRQRKVLKQMIKKYKTLSRSRKIQLIVENAAAIDTDMSLDELAALIKEVSGYKIKDYGFPFFKWNYLKKTEQEKDGLSWLMVPCDLVTNVNKLHKTVYGEKNYKASETVKKYSKALKKETGYSYEKRAVNWDNRY